MKEEDILLITADHGCDPTTAGTDHTREYVPLLVYGRHTMRGVNLSIRHTFADLAATAAQYLGLDAPVNGVSFMGKILS